MTPEEISAATQTFEQATGTKLPPPKAAGQNARVVLPPRKALWEYGDVVPDLGNTLLADRFLCREGGMLFVGPSGIGKSSASIQQDSLWCIGEAAFGICPARPLKIVGIQAEDDEGDLYEFIAGARLNLKLTADQDRLCRANCAYYCHKALTGHEFLQGYLRPVLARDRPDLVRLNPLQAYLGGDVKDTALVSGFLRNGLNPLLEEFQCAAIIVCHTPKTNFRTTEKWRFSDWQYAVAGAGDLTNWARTILVIEPTPIMGVHKFIAAKRGARIGWENEYGDRETSRYFAHAERGIFWQPATEQQIAEALAGKPEVTTEDVLRLLPPDGTAVWKQDFLMQIRQELKLAKHPAWKLVDQLVAENRIVAAVQNRRVYLSLDNNESF